MTGFYTRIGSSILKDLFELFITFAKIGALTFGGGYAMLPMLIRELVGNREWTTEEELLNCFSIGQCTPGTIACNTSTFIGYKRRGLLGAAVATLGMVFPSFVIITLIAGAYNTFSENQYVMHAMAGVRVAVVALILTTVIKLWQSGVKGVSDIIIFLIAFTVVAIFGLSPLWVVGAAIVLGLVRAKVGGSAA